MFSSSCLPFKPASCRTQRFPDKDSSLGNRPPVGVICFSAKIEWSSTEPSFVGSPGRSGHFEASLRQVRWLWTRTRWFQLGPSNERFSWHSLLPSVPGPTTAERTASAISTSDLLVERFGFFLLLIRWLKSKPPNSGAAEDFFDWCMRNIKLDA